MALRVEGLDALVAPELEIDAILERAADFNPDIAVLDLYLGELLSIPLIRPLTDRGVTVVMLTGVKDKAMLGRCLEEGAVGVISKEADFDSLRQAVLDASRGQAVLSERERVDLLEAAAEQRRLDKDRLAPFRTLTKREAVILSHLAQARSAEEIAQAEFVSLATVRSQIQAVLRKLGVNSQLAAVALARDAGWPPPTD